MAHPAQCTVTSPGDYHLFPALKHDPGACRLQMIASGDANNCDTMDGNTGHLLIPTGNRKSQSTTRLIPQVDGDCLVTSSGLAVQLNVNCSWQSWKYWAHSVWVVNLCTLEFPALAWRWRKMVKISGLQPTCDSGTLRMQSSHCVWAEQFCSQFVVTDSSKHWRYSEQKGRRLWPDMFITWTHLSLEADSFLAGQKSPHLLWKVLYSVYKRWPLHLPIQSASSHHTSFRPILIILLHTPKQFQATKFQTRNFYKKFKKLQY
jgi:hypothetical protein